ESSRRAMETVGVSGTDTLGTRSGSWRGGVLKSSVVCADAGGPTSTESAASAASTAKRRLLRDDSDRLPRRAAQRQAAPVFEAGPWPCDLDRALGIRARSAGRQLFTAGIQFGDEAHRALGDTQEHATSLGSDDGGG